MLIAKQSGQQKKKTDLIEAVCAADVAPECLWWLCPLHVTLQIYNEERRRFNVVRNQPRKIVEKVASDIEKLLAKKRKALDVSNPHYNIVWAV